jgi:hypothetical protein
LYLTLAKSKPDNVNISATDERVYLELRPSPFLMGTTSKLRRGDTWEVYKMKSSVEVKEICSE